MAGPSVWLHLPNPPMPDKARVPAPGLRLSHIKPGAEPGVNSRPRRLQAPLVPAVANGGQTSHLQGPACAAARGIHRAMLDPAPTRLSLSPASTEGLGLVCLPGAS